LGGDEYMQVESSLYLKNIKPILQELLNSLLQKYKYASILATDSKSRLYNVSKRGTVITEDEIISGRGFVVRVYDGTSYCEYSFNEIDKERVPEILDKIENELITLKNVLPDGITESKFDIINDEPCEFNKSSEYETNPWQFGSSKIVDFLTKLSESGRAFDEKILDCSASITCQQYHKLFLSGNKDMEQNILWTTGLIMMMASRGEEVKYYYKSYSNLGGTELLKEMENDISSVAKTTLELLESKPIKPGEYDCICAPDVSGVIAHEAFGHGVEMDMFVKKRALAEKYIDEYVASPLVTMHDGAAAAKETGSYMFDDEGVPAQDTVIIDKGILKRGISDVQTALRLGTTPTGNGRRQSYERKAYTRMTNTYFEAGKDKVEDMISSIEYGFLLENCTSGMEDPKNWGIQLMVNIAREIKNGRLTGKVYSPVVLTGYVPDLLKSISMVSDKVKLSGSGFCGKGYKEWVKVSDGGPYIKARIRLG